MQNKLSLSKLERTLLFKRSPTGAWEPKTELFSQMSCSSIFPAMPVISTDTVNML